MQSRDLSSCQTVTSQAQAKAFEDPLKRQIVLRCAHKAKNISAIAEAFSISLQKAHYHVARLLECGLLKVVDEKPRKGRAIKFYQSIGNDFFVPRMLMEDPGQRLRKDFFETIDDAKSQSMDGSRIFVDKKGRMRILVVKDDKATSSDVFEMWIRLELSSDEADDFRSEMIELLQRFQKKPNGAEKNKTKKMLFHAALAPTLIGLQ